MTQILIVEDDAKVRAFMTFHLENAGYQVAGVGDAEMAQDYLRSQSVDLMLVDIRLGLVSGVELVRRLSARGAMPPTIIVSGEASLQETMEALKQGVYDFIEKPAGRERLLQSVKNCLELETLKKRIHRLEKQAPTRTAILGTGEAVSRLRQQIQKVALTNGRVLIRGESGSGKELVAAAIHEQSARAGKPFVKVNCAAIPAHLIEDELFGHVKGAFTDARTDKPGLFEQAHGGTLFLDEIGDMDFALQSRLLRVLEEGIVRRVGGTRDIPVDVRVIAASHRDLGNLIESQQFRGDLFYRLSAVPLEVPPLRDRSEDIPLLFAHFSDMAATEHQLPKRNPTSEVLTALQTYHWPGNVRELKNIVERLVIFGGEPITLDQLPNHILRGNPNQVTPSSGLLATSRLKPFVPLKDFKLLCETEYLELVLAHSNWNVSEAARILEIPRPYLHQKMKQFGITRPGT